jgi:hypothetical protein
LPFETSTVRLPLETVSEWSPSSTVIVWFLVTVTVWSLPTERV